MQTFQLSLEPDERFPRFKRLAYQKVEVSLAEVLLQGVHPWDSGSPIYALIHRFVEQLNAEKLYLPGFKELGYGLDYNQGADGERHWDLSGFERLLANIHDRIFFVEQLTYQELIGIAKKALADNWDHQTVRTLVGRVYHDFNAIRDFLKKKDKNLKLSGYNDIDRYDLSRICTLEDFEGEDQVIIGQALPSTNFRSTDFLEKVTGECGRLQLAPSIDHFQMIVSNGFNGYYEQALVYNEARYGNQLRLHPVLSHRPAARDQATQIAQAWRLHNGRYCFTVDVKTAERMLDQGAFRVSFPRLTYPLPEEGEFSSAGLQIQAIERFGIGRFVGTNSSGNVIKDILGRHNVSMTGRKEDLIEKLASLASSVYQDRLDELDSYFCQNLFIKMPNAGNHDPVSFPVINDCDMKNMVLAMYLMKHLRGNTILDAAHNNDTFDLVSLAKALIMGEVTLSGAFVRALGGKHTDPSLN